MRRRAEWKDGEPDSGQATIVDGPSAVGFYRIEIPLDGGVVWTSEEALLIPLRPLLILETGLLRRTRGTMSQR